MGRLPFDPAKMRARASALTPPCAEPAHVTVSQLATMVERSLRDHLPATVRVVGEIGQFRERTHWYFDLKDQGAVISCVMFASAARKVGFVPRVGQQVLLGGRVEFYGKQGRTQFVADKLQAVGEGAHDAAFRRLCDELRGLGWFEDGRKRPLPMFPARVAVITSRTGAALQDVLDTARRRCPAIPIALIDARVQGDDAAAQVTAAVRRLSARHTALGVDVILITRGGGSMEDLWCFNDRGLAEAIIKSPIPVVAAIGHETDTTIAEMVADLRGATPTQAAMRIFPDSADLRRQLASLGARLNGQLTRRLRLERERLRGAARHPFLTDPALIVTQRRKGLGEGARRLATSARLRLWDAQARLDRLVVRLERHRPGVVYARRQSRLVQVEALLHAAIGHRLRAVDLDGPRRRLHSAFRNAAEHRQAGLESLARGLDLVGPHSVLRRGYSVTLGADGRAVRSRADVLPGDIVRTRLADGGFSSVVRPDGDGIAPLRPAAGPMKAARRAAARARPPKDQLDLFGSGR
jgi:exodeoxyribonuclease VII large subunit